MTPALKALLDAIGSKEAPKGYGQIYGGAKGVPKNTDVSKLTLAAVMELQENMLHAGSASTACGRYQFIRKTLAATVAEMGLKGAEVWTPALQDEMALHLLRKRGLAAYLLGKMSSNDFANNLAMEWASLPVVTRIRGQKRMVEPGETFYAGDGLNRAHHKPEAVLALVKALKAPQMTVQPDPTVPDALAPEPMPEPVAPRPRGLLAALIDLLTLIFKRRT